MKVLQILPELNAGGVERGTLEIARALIAEGHEAVVVSNGGRLVTELEKIGAKHVTLPVHRKSLGSLFQVRALRRVFEQERPDIVHIRSRVPGWIAWLAWRKMDPLKRPHLVSTVHGFYSVNAYSAIMVKGERVIAVSESIRDYILKNYPQVPADVIRVVPRGVTLEQYPRGFTPAAEWLASWQAAQPQCAGKAVLLIPGRITRLKGHEDFFQLLAGLKKAGIAVHGLVVGDTHPKKRAYLAELRARSAELGVGEDVSFLGHRSDVREIMAVSDIVYSLSQQPESFGRVTLETLALGRAFIGYDHGGVGEQLRPFFPAGCVRLGDQAGLLAATQRVLRERPVPGVVGEPYTLKCMCESSLAVYKELVTKP
ncbi:glycosyltransferase family 4 protein [Rariglobus hedericola]|uniref:Glycosyltransferase family 4 protein n=1 Tax=Rariglobus hedericola TaxID=2597822 RepID=A0A556QNV2_9BACT|nr:glycosyltransferase family 4 protein [Rariglobus hedericola]TSJ78330.1 glycosyltransferase family 4 protein [Rariglobus hedericola]